MTELFLQVIYLSDSIRFPVSCFISGILDICKNKLLSDSDRNISGFRYQSSGYHLRRQNQPIGCRHEIMNETPMILDDFLGDNLCVAVQLSMDLPHSFT